VILIFITRLYAKNTRNKELEKEIAEMFGKEAALFMPSGTMSNLIASR
jgi:threonine aldolase